MKLKTICMLIAATGIFLACVQFTSCRGASDRDRNRVTVSGAWAMYPVMVKWAEEYNKLNPHIIIDISAGGAGKGVTDALTGMVDLGMVSREINQAEIERGLWWISVVKDAVVPIINTASPVAEIISKRGLTGDELRDIWLSDSAKNWNAIGDIGDFPLRVYTRSDACGAAETWAVYLGGVQEDLKGTGVFGDPGIVEVIRKDTHGAGYGNINYVYDFKTRRPLPGIMVIPLDLNKDGRIGESEANYETLEHLVEAIRDGRFPSPPARGLHLVSRGVPERETVRDFIKWILEDGQQYVTEAGFVRLADEFISAQKAKLIQGEN